MIIGSIGYNSVHSKEFLMDRPDGPGCYLFLLIKSGADFEINNVSYQLNGGYAVIISPSTPCRYCASDDLYIDDWMYFNITDEERDKFIKNGLPFDKPVSISNLDELSQIMHIMMFEHYSAASFHDEIKYNYADILLMKVSRIVNSGINISSNVFVEKHSHLTNIRTRIYNTPEQIPGISELANEFGMSRSGFQHLYKRMFGVSVMSDVIAGRIEKAKNLLISTNLKIAEIAAKCGYGSEYSFMRQFKKICGCTPTEYRKGK